MGWVTTYDLRVERCPRARSIGGRRTEDAMAQWVDQPPRSRLASLPLFYRVISGQRSYRARAQSLPRAGAGVVSPLPTPLFPVPHSLYSRLRSPCPHARRPRPRPVPSLTCSPRRSPILHLLITIHAINALRSSPNLGVHNKQEAAAGLKHSEHAAPPSRRWAFLFIHSASDSCAPSLTNPGRASLLS